MRKVNLLIGVSILAIIGMVVTDPFRFAGVAAQDEVKEQNDQRQNESTAAIFTNSAAITIAAQGVASPYPSTINVSGLGGAITSVKVTLNSFSHTFPDDVGIVLVGPNGDALLLMDGAGDAEPMSGVTFSLADSGATQLPNLTAWAAGTYKPTAYYTGDSFPAPGPGVTYGHPGPAVGGGTATFASVFNGDTANGNWNLFAADFASGDSGSISGGWTIEITTAAVTDVPVDMNGDGKTDYVVTRNTGGGAGGQETWFVQNNATGAMTSQPWGINSDFRVPSDYDGDGKDDFAVWRPGAQGAFFIINSGTNTIRVSNCGITGDNPTVVGDYNGDGKDDVAVYRAGATAGAPSTFYWRPNDTVDFTAVVHGQNGDFVAPGDYDGDGKQDFGVQRNAGGGVANFIIKFVAGGADQTIPFGTPNDVVVPGDYDGDGKTDICTIRGVGGFIQWQYRRSIDSATVVDTWGISATDSIAQGDYNGDGKTDYGVWRPGAQGEFFVMTPVTRQISSRQWGVTGDYPVANYNTH